MSKRQRDEAELEDNLELSPEQIRELKRRVKDLEDPIRYARAVIHEYCEGKRDNLFIAKITTKNNRRKVLKYRWSEHRTG